MLIYANQCDSLIETVLLTLEDKFTFIPVDINCTFNDIQVWWLLGVSFEV